MQEPVSILEPERPGRAGVALRSIFLSPTRAFQEIARGASWVVPFLVTSALAIVGLLLMRPLQRAAMEARLQELSGPQAEQMAKMGELQLNIGVGFAPLMILVMWVLGALVFKLALAATGASLPFKKVFRGMAYAGVIGTALPFLLTGILVNLKARNTEFTGAADAPRMGLDLIGGEGFVRGVLSTFNVFNIWWLVVLVFGFAVLTGRTPRRVAPAVIAAGLFWMVLMGVLEGFNLR